MPYCAGGSVHDPDSGISHFMGDTMYVYDTFLPLDQRGLINTPITCIKYVRVSELTTMEQAVSCQVEALRENRKQIVNCPSVRFSTCPSGRALGVSMVNALCTGNKT